MGRPWIKLSTAMFDDEKIKLIELMPDGKAMLVIWLKLLCFAGKTDNEGVFRFTKEIPYNEEMFASIFGENINTVRLALQTFIKFGMMEKIEGTYALTNWTKYQSETAAIERAKEKKHERQKRWREKQKTLLLGTTSQKRDVSKTSPRPSTDVKETHTELEEEKELEEELDIEGTTKNNCLSAAAAFNNQYSVNKEVLTREGETTLPNGVKTVEFYNKNVFPLTSSYERERLLDLADEYGDEWCIAACKEAIDHQARSIAYIDKVLRTWRAKGFKSVPGKQETKRDTQYDDIPF
nr:MAG TPA: replisome organizer [Caudoviricetes sp.]